MTVDTLRAGSAGYWYVAATYTITGNVTQESTALGIGVKLLFLLHDFFRVRASEVLHVCSFRDLDACSPNITWLLFLTLSSYSHC